MKEISLTSFYKSRETFRLLFRLAVIGLITSPVSIFAQWTTSGNNISNSNSGNVGVGTSSPAVKLDVLSAVAQIARFDSSASANSEVLINAASGFSSGLTLQRGATSKWFLRNVAANDRLSFLSSDGSSERMTLLQSGNVGIGTNNPVNILHIVNNQDNATVVQVDNTTNGTNSRSIFFLNYAGGAGSGALQYAAPSFSLGAGYEGLRGNALTLYTNSGASGGVSIVSGGPSAPMTFTVGGYGSSAERLRITSAGSVGIGTTAPGYRLDVSGGQINSSGGLCIAGDCKTAWSQVGSSQWSTSGTTINYATGNVGIATASPTEKLHVTGNVKVTGSITVDGNINAKYQDMAEWVESSQQLTAGTVVVLDTTNSNQVIASGESYDTRVAGVISLTPGIALGEQGKGRVLVATTGRVKVKVDATNGPIRIGDLLVTSNLEGTAMKSEPVELAGRKMHLPGTIIGKALEPLTKGRGEILVLLSLQ